MPSAAQNDSKRTAENGLANARREGIRSETWHAIARRYDQRNRSDKRSAYTAQISNNIERDRARDVEQVDGVRRSFVNEAVKFENRFGKITHEAKMLAVDEILVNFRFRGTTLKYDELIVALENIIIQQGIHSPKNQTEEKST